MLLRPVTGGERRILSEDRRVEPLERGRRLDSELVHQFASRVEIGL
jgi:hypothetical protein